MARYMKLYLLVVFCLALASASFRPQMVRAGATSTIYLPTVSGAAVQANAGTGRTYYVDCAAGSDSNNGLSEASAWRGMGQANSAPLRAGDSLLFKRSCTWNQRLDAKWTGTASQPITISAYGQGALPLIQNGKNQNVKITGSYQVIEYLRTRYDAVEVDAQCNSQPIGSYVGFNFLPGATHNTLRYSEASDAMAGVRISSEANHNRILSNRLTNNGVMQRWLRGDPSGDLGAWGILINGNDNEIGFNYLADNNALCSYGWFRHGNSIELYQAQRNNIHHNSAYNDRVFSESGGSSASRAADNTFAFNLHVTAEPRARFLVVRGSGDSWGPTWRTVALNNTVYLTHPTSQGVVCHSGCSSDILTLKNNIIWGEEKAVYADAPFNEGNNLYWRADGAPRLDLRGFTMSATSRKLNPQFAAAAAQDFRLVSTSPAINAGNSAPVEWGFTSDLDGTSVPQYAAVDIGGYESLVVQ